MSQRTQLRQRVAWPIWRKSALLPPQGSNGAYSALAAAILEGDSSIPLCVRDALAPIIRQLAGAQRDKAEIAVSDRAIIELVKTDANARRLMSVPGIGPITASAIAASVQDVGAFSRAHESSQRSSDWRRDRTRLAVRSASDACQKWETDISAKLLGRRHPCCPLPHRKAHQDGLPGSVGGEAHGNQTIQACCCGDSANKLARIAFAVMRDGSTHLRERQGRIASAPRLDQVRRSPDRG